MTFIKSHWKLILIGCGVIVLLLWIGSVTGASGKLYNMMLDQLRTDQSRIIEVQAESQKWYEETIASLQQKLNLKEKQLKVVDEALVMANQTIDAKEAEILALRREREKITTSSDPDSIVRDLRKLGYSSERRRLNK